MDLSAFDQLVPRPLDRWLIYLPLVWLGGAAVAAMLHTLLRQR